MRHTCLVLGVSALLASTACNKRQILPGTIAGVGMGVSVGGFIHSATRPEGSGFWGKSTGDAAAIGSMIFGGAAMAICGILFAITSVDCESDGDCWAGDVCLIESSTCVSAQSIVRVLPEPPGDPAVSGAQDPAAPVPSAPAGSEPAPSESPSPESALEPGVESATASP